MKKILLILGLFFIFIANCFGQLEIEKCVGQCFVGLNEFNGGSENNQTLETGEKWKCISFKDISNGITTENKWIVIFENSKKEQITIDYNEFITKINDNEIYTLQNADNYLKKFGKKKWLSILNRKIVIGMTEEMCELSWGKPNNINTTTTKGTTIEQWVYDNNAYLYFKNGILTSFQN